MTVNRVIVLDDEPGITALCDRLLNGEGFSPKAFTDPKQALKYLQENQTDLLVVDIRMPTMSGFDVILEARRHLPDIAILVMTGYGTVETAIQALHEGVDGLLLKPFEKKEFLSSVHQAISDNQKKRDSARVQALRPLFDVTESLLAETRSEFLTQYIMDAVCRLLQCPHAGYFETKGSGVSLGLVASRGQIPSSDGDAKALEVVYQCDKTGVPILINADGPGETNLHTVINSLGYGAVICVPVKRNNFRGVFLAARELNAAPFRETDLELCQILTRQAAIAMENAQLYKELRDYITRIEESQVALVQAEKLATAGRMTASIAHEINNPLQAVQNCLHLAARSDLPSDMRQKYFEMTQTELERLMNTVQRMLEFYRPNIERENVNVVDLLDNVLNLMASQLQGRGIRVTNSWSPKIPDIMAVSSQIQQVFINLILNAFDAMPQGGELIIKVSEIKKNIEIIFQDTGPGVPNELRPSIFEPFTSTKEKGTGLGLSVSYGIIVSHGGNLELLSDFTAGACFRITLPVSEK
jgi:signal transduction histidine kinase/FixJ family two-component response regulator